MFRGTFAQFVVSMTAVLCFIDRNTDGVASHRYEGTNSVLTNERGSYVERSSNANATSEPLCDVRSYASELFWSLLRKRFALYHAPSLILLYAPQCYVRTTVRTIHKDAVIYVENTDATTERFARVKLIGSINGAIMSDILDFVFWFAVRTTWLPGAINGSKRDNVGNYGNDLGNNEKYRSDSSTNNNNNNRNNNNNEECCDVYIAMTTNDAHKLYNHGGEFSSSTLAHAASTFVCFNAAIPWKINASELPGNIYARLFSSVALHGSIGNRSFRNYDSPKSNIEYDSGNHRVPRDDFYAYDLLLVAIHEVGHWLGMSHVYRDHITVMFAFYNPVRTDRNDLASMLASRDSTTRISHLTARDIRRTSQLDRCLTEWVNVTRILRTAETRNAYYALRRDAPVFVANANVRHYSKVSKLYDPCV